MVFTNCIIVRAAALERLTVKPNGKVFHSKSYVLITAFYVSPVRKKFLKKFYSVFGRQLKRVKK